MNKAELQTRVAGMIAKATTAASKTWVESYGYGRQVASKIAIALPGSALYERINAERKADAKPATAYLRAEHYRYAHRDSDPLSVTGTLLPARDDREIGVKNIPIIAGDGMLYDIEHLLRADGPAVVALKVAGIL